MIWDPLEVKQVPSVYHNSLWKTPRGISRRSAEKEFWIYWVPYPLSPRSDGEPLAMEKKKRSRCQRTKDRSETTVSVLGKASMTIFGSHGWASQVGENYISYNFERRPSRILIWWIVDYSPPVWVCPDILFIDETESFDIEKKIKELGGELWGVLRKRHHISWQTDTSSELHVVAVGFPG